MRRGLGKAHPRLLAVDDGAFSRGDRFAPLAAVVVSLPDQLEAVAVGRVRVDGRDATRQISGLLRELGSLEGIHAVLLDGVVVGGFNIVDLTELSRAVRRPVVAVTRRHPDFPRIRSALRTWFPRTAALRERLLRQHRLFRVATGAQPLWAAAAGCSADDAERLVRRTMVHGYWPEPLRLAHLIASATGAFALDRRVKGRPRRGTAGPVA